MVRTNFARVAGSALLTICAVSALFGEGTVEPGLTSRIAVLALLRMPPQARSALSGLDWQAVERLQSPPVLTGEEPATQIKLVFEQVAGRSLSPELLASAARAAVALSLPAGTGDDPSWTGFRTAVALRAAGEDVSQGVAPTITDVGTFTADLRRQGDALRTQVHAATGDGAKMLELRNRAASTAAKAVMSAWGHMLAIRAPVASPSPKTENPAGQAVSTEPTGQGPTGAASSPSTAPAATGYIGNKSSKKFHRPNCRSVPSAANRVVLPSREEAIRQGYQPCHICKP